MKYNRLVSSLLALSMVLSLAWTGAPAARAVEAAYTFEASALTAAADKEALSGGSFAGGFITTFGELTMRTGSDGSVKSVEVGKNGASGLTFTIAGTAEVKVEFSSTGGSNTSTAGLWNEAGELVPNNEGVTTVSGTDKTAVSYSGLAAGVYKVVSPDASEHNRGARVYSLSITETTEGERAPRKAWAEVTAPTVTAAEAKDGKITVTYAMATGYDGADSVKVSMLSGGAEVQVKEGEEGVAVFTPDASGKYTFTVTASRAGEADKTAALDAPVDYSKPLAAPAVSSVTSAGSGKIGLVWESVDEATGYNVYLDGGDKAVNKAPITALEYEVTGLKVGASYTFTVTALRGEEESAPSKAAQGEATKDAQQVWSFATFGASTKPENNYAEGDLNRDGKVSVISTNGSGKILAASTDGLAFYYTAIPVDKNFTLRAKVHINSWENRSSQNGFGVAALDRVGSGAKDFWNNSALVGGMRYSYYYDKSTGTLYSEADPNHLGDKYNMRLGIASLFRSGVTHEGMDAMGGEITAPVGFSSLLEPLDRYALDEGKAPGTYNLIDNGSALECDSLDNVLSDFVLEVQRNNTGYFMAYYDASGKLIRQNKTYDPKALDQLDSEFVYAGFFTSRLMNATFSDVTLKINDPAEDPKPEAKPKTQIMPKVLVYSADAANSADYDLIVSANAAGKLAVKVNGGSSATGAIATPDGRADLPVKLDPGKNDITVTFAPDPKQTFADPDTELGSAEAVTVAHTVTWDDRFAGRKVLYTAPGGDPGATGGYFDPIDVPTAVSVAAPGQTIVVREGRYELKAVKIKKGMSGTEDKPIYMIADPDAASKPVFDFGGTGSGIWLEGDWWYISGIDVTRANDEGVSVSGSHNVLDQVDTYYNLATGVQIARSSRADSSIDYWPSYNLVLNCTSYGNADPGYSDADGFGAKLTAGRGNVFDGCVAYHNSDDGWDLYAKAEQGPIGKVVVRNCIAFKNGYLEDGTNAGDGNGFKMGGESITGYHELHDSFSFYNKNCGVTTNSCPDLQLFDVTSFDNEHLNVNFYTKLAKNTDFGAQGVLSYKTAPTPEQFDQFAYEGSQDTSKVLNETNYFWDSAKTVNSAGKEVGAGAFVSLDFQGFTRKADGTLDLGDFLKRSDAAPAGATLGGTPSKTFSRSDLAVDGDHSYEGKTVTFTAADGTSVTVTDGAGKTVAAVSIPDIFPDGADFADVPAEHWAARAINDMSALGLMKGVDDAAKLYAPAAAVTRASLAQILARLSNAATGSKADFSDVAAGAWYADAVAWCAGVGVVTGYADGRFGPDDTITREQLATMLRRCAVLLDLDTSADAGALDNYAGSTSVGAWARAGMTWAVSKGIITGKDGGVLDPQGTASRAECAVMMRRFLTLIVHSQD